MKGTEGPGARGTLYKQLDLERKHAKQAEARLSQHVRRLEQACLHHLRLLTWEQRQLQRELRRLQQASIRKTCPSHPGNGAQERPGDVPVCPPQGGKHGAPRARVRALATNSAQGIHKPRSQLPRSRHTGLEDPMKSGEQPLSQSHTTSRFTEEKPPDPAVSTDPAVSSDPADPGPGAGPAGGPGVAHGDEARSEDVDLQPEHSDADHMSPRAAGCAGSLNGVSSASSFLELFAKAANAHYLRHKVPPESERLLSIREIFGHGDSATQSRAASKSPPL